MPRVAITQAQAAENQIYRNIKAACVLYGFTQEQIGRALGISQGGASLALKNRTLTVNQLCSLCDEMGLTVEIKAK